MSFYPLLSFIWNLQQRNGPDCMLAVHDCIKFCLLSSNITYKSCKLFRVDAKLEYGRTDGWKIEVLYPQSSLKWLFNFFFFSSLLEALYCEFLLLRCYMAFLSPIGTQMEIICSLEFYMEVSFRFGNAKLNARPVNIGCRCLLVLLAYWILSPMPIVRLFPWLWVRHLCSDRSWHCIYRSCNISVCVEWFAFLAFGISYLTLRSCGNNWQWSFPRLG